MTDLRTRPTENRNPLHAVGDRRWRPTRAGIVNLWRYWDETFTFHAGRLLLRGANGSGKSMALELLLPFLLDADASPHRLTSAARSRGGLYERVMTGTTDTSRAGFAWVEFRRGDGDTFTVGVRIQASANTHKADPSFFTTTQRIGTDLRLLDDHRVPVTRKVLGERIGICGRVHSSRDEHRAAVREVLFPEFSSDRYDSVITALLALRKEKLSQNLDIAKLSDVLSEALPPIDEHDLAAVAEGFERLDRRRAELAALEAEVEEVRALEKRGRDYARAVLASAANDVRAAETRRDDVTRAEREARDGLAGARAEAQRLADDIGTLSSRLADLDVEINALKASEAYRSGVALDDLRAESGRLRDALRRDAKALDRATERYDRAVSDRLAAVSVRDQAIDNHDRAVSELRTAAEPVGAEEVVVDALALGDGDQGESLVRAWVQAHRAGIDEMRRAVRTHDGAVERRAFVEEQREREQVALDARVVERRQAAAQHVDAIEQYLASVTAWSASSVVVGRDRILAALPSPPDDPDAVRAALADLSVDIRAEHGRQRQVLDAEREAIEAERLVLREERAELAEGRIIEPPAPPWRDPRTDAGAPLWRLVDVAAGADPADVDGAEAALGAAGLLDAWVRPDGSIEVPDGRADVVLGVRPRTGRTLVDLLVAIGETVVPAEVVSGVLASIALVPSASPPAGSGSTGASPGADGPEVAIGTDGTFRLGAAAGRGAVQAAGLLGAEAQERRRQARLAELDGLIEAVDRRVAEVETKLRSVDLGEAAALAEIDAAPDGGAVVRAASAVTIAEARVEDARGRVGAARREVEQAEAAVRDALRALTVLAAQSGLPTTAEALDAVSEAVTGLERAVSVWARRSHDLARSERAVAQADQAVTEAQDDRDEQASAHATTERDLADVAGRLATLESAIGDEHRETLRRLGQLQDEQRGARGRLGELNGQRPGLERRIGKLEGELASAEQSRRETDETRAETHRRFTAVLADGFGADAGAARLPGEPPEGITAVLEAARTVGTELERVASDDAAVDRASKRVQEQLHHARTALGSRIDVTFEQAPHGWWLLRGAIAGFRRRVGELATALAADLDHGRAELAADEERLFEQTLAGTVRQALAERIRLANDLVERINGQLAAVRTSAGGVQVRLRWDVDADQAAVVKAARALLLRDPADLTDDERASLQNFVRTRVDQARAELEANAPWEARLRETLDYRVWHRFSLLLGHRDWQGFEKATPQRLQRLSTGERSIALHLPMLASLAAHYTDEAGQPAPCPRLVLLDELFAGVDPANRAQLFGTFTAWDLDAVFTSDHEWCQYATLDGIAIHHLHASSGDEPVVSTRFWWDGSNRRLDAGAA